MNDHVYNEEKDIKALCVAVDKIREKTIAIEKDVEDVREKATRIEMEVHDVAIQLGIIDNRTIPAVKSDVKELHDQIYLGENSLKSRIVRTEDLSKSVKDLVLENRVLVQEKITEIGKMSRQYFVTLVSISTIFISGCFGVLWFELRDEQAQLKTLSKTMATHVGKTDLGLNGEREWKNAVQ